MRYLYLHRLGLLPVPCACWAVLLCLALLPHPVAHAQAAKDEWIPIGPWGGDKFEVYVDPSDNTTLYVVGANILKSTDKGETWTSLQNPTEETVGLDAYSLAFDPRDTAVIYLGTMNGVWKTTNGGNAWDRIWDETPETDGMIRKVLVDWENPDTVYASTTDCGMACQRFTYVRSDVLASAVYRSADGGSTWEPFSEGLPEPYTPVNDIYQHPLTGELFLATFGDGVFVYDPVALAWQPINSGLGDPLGFYITRLALDPNDPDVMFATTHKDWVYRTTDGGALWDALPFPETLDAPYPPMAYFVVLDPNNGEKMYVGAMAGGDHTDETPFFQSHDDQSLGGLWLSQDGGDSFQKLDWIRTNPDGGPFGMTFDPSEVLSEPHMRSKNIYVANGGIHCVMKSEDGGSTFEVNTEGIASLWINAFLQHPLDGNKLFSTSLSVLHFSFDGGATWSRYLPVVESLELIYIWDLAIAPDSPDVLYYATGNPAFNCPDEKGLYQVDVTGLDPAEPANRDGPGVPVPGTAGVGIWRVYAGAGGRLFLATQNDGILWSDDGGGSWTEMNEGLDPDLLSVTAILFDAYGMPFLAGTREADGTLTSVLFGENGVGERGALYRWDGDLGIWVRVADSVDTPVHALAQSPTDPDRLYAATQQGLFVSDDGGDTWEGRGLGLPDADWFGLDLAVHPTLDPDFLSLASWAAGVFVSTDGGGHWMHYPEGMYPSRAQRVVWDRHGSDTMYVSSIGGSVWRNDLEEMPVVDEVLSDGVPLAEPYAASKRELEAFQISVSAHDPDGDPLSYRAYLNGSPVPDPADNPEGKLYTFDPATRVFDWEPPFNASQNGPYELVFEVFDGFLKKYAEVSLAVQPIHPPVVDQVLSDGAPLEEPYSVNKSELETFTIVIEAHDPDGDPLSYKALLNGGLVPDPADNPESLPFTFDPSTRTFVWETYYTASADGPWVLEFVVRDGILQPARVTVDLVVEPIYPPVVDAVSSDGVGLSEPLRVTKTEHIEAFQISISAHDPDGDPLICSAFLNGDPVPNPADNPEGKRYTFDPATRAFVWSPPCPVSENSPHDLLFVVSDGVLAPVNVSVELSVEPLPLPTIDSVTANGILLPAPYQVVVRERESLQIQFEAGSDWAGAPTRDAYCNGQDVPTPGEVDYPPEYYSFDPATGTFSYIPLLNTAGDTPKKLSLIAITPPVWNSVLVEVYVRPAEGSFECADCLPLTDPGAYGKIMGGDETHADEVNYSFDGVPGDVVIAYEIWDVDAQEEVEILVNGVPLGFAAGTPDGAWSRTRLVVLPDAAVFDGGMNVLTFSNTYNPPGEEWWGVREVSVWDGCPECIPVPDGGAYGRITGGDQSHVNEVTYRFDGIPGDVEILYEVWDVDFADEVEILLNGVPLEYAPVTANESWSGLQSILLPDGAVLDGNSNVLTFNNTCNPPKTYWWGVASVSILEAQESSACIPLPDTGAYGRISGGDSSHIEEVCYSFEGVPGDVTLVYEVWDVDFADEVEILLNGVFLEYASVTADKSWSGLRSILLPDAAVLDGNSNVLTFSNTHNPPETYWWGVGNVSILEAQESAGCIPLPDTAAYGRISGGDSSHIEEVCYSFEGVPGDVTLVYEVWDVDFAGEVEILLNGVRLESVSVTANESWSGLRSILLPDAVVFDGDGNVLTFNNAYNPPHTYAWGVGNVSVLQAQACPDCIPLPDTGAYGRIAGGDQTHVEEVNYSFEGLPGDITIAYGVWDVDFADEVEIRINGTRVACAGVTPDATWSEIRYLILPDAAVLDTETNVLTFSNAYNPPHTYWWGVGTVSID